MLTKTEEKMWKLMRQWPLPLAHFAVQVVTRADAIVWLLRAIHDPEGSGGFVRTVDPQQWIPLYRRHRQVWAAAVCGDREMVDELIGAGTQLDRMSKREIEPLLQQLTLEEVEAIQGFRELFILSIRAAANEIEGKSDAEDPIEALLTDDFDSIEIQFLLRVSLPCWICYGKSAGRLMRDARRGDLESVCELLALDRLAIADRKIIRIIDQESRRSTVWEKRFQKALGTRQSRKFEPAEVKRRLASMISAFGGRFPRKVTEPEIRQLFDLVAQARSELRDSALPEASETLAKYFQRERSKWVLPDRESPADVRAV